MLRIHWAVHLMTPVFSNMSHSVERYAGACALCCCRPAISHAKQKSTMYQCMTGSSVCVCVCVCVYPYLQLHLVPSPHMPLQVLSCLQDTKHHCNNVCSNLGSGLDRCNVPVMRCHCSTHICIDMYIHINMHAQSRLTCNMRRTACYKPG